MLLRILSELLASPWRGARLRRAYSHAKDAGACERAGDYEGARREYEQALGITQTVPEWWLGLGDVRFRQGDLDKAAVCYRHALEALPGAASPKRRLAAVSRAVGNLDDAIDLLRRAHDIDADALRELVDALIERDACDKALAVAQSAVARDPGSYQAKFCVALAHHKRHDSAAALAACEAARQLRADDAELHDLHGAILQECGRLDEAIAEYDRALALRPDFVLARFHRALAALLTGDFARGWDGYELRRLNERRHASGRGVAQWDGSPLAGRTLWVTREQGLGDEIMFASLIPEVMAGAGRCLLECDARLVALFRRSFPGATVFASLPGGELPQALHGERVDLAAGAGSLPRFLRSSPSAFPRHEGYLRADPQRVDRWRQRLAALGPGRKVGISWSGGVRKTRRALRSLDLAQWVPILKTAGSHFVSLQYTAGAAQEAGAFGVAHWQEAIDDLDEMAALVCALDLVISVCTSAVHLAGALGRPAWVLTPYAPEWRYGMAGESMIWYPSVRLFRQSAPGDWRKPVASVAARLGEAAQRA